MYGCVSLHLEAAVVQAAWATNSANSIGFLILEWVQLYIATPGIR
jgi:hypothetical protein